jgi:hypothetical protein
MARRFTWVLAALALLVGGVRPAKATFVITFSQSGSDVVASGVGSLNFLDLSFSDFETGPNFVDASAGAVLLGPVPSNTSDIFVGDISGPTTFGPGGNFPATSGDSTAPGGTGAGINVAAQELYVPGGYAPNAPFTVSATWADTTIGGLGLTPGTYTWTWGTTNPDSLTVIIPGTVPEPASLTLAALGVAAMLGYGRKRKRAA